MFVGHTAVALAARPRTPTVSLGWGMAAAYALDLIWPVLVLLGIERVEISPGVTEFMPLDFVSYPWSHSLATSLLWGGLAAIVARALGVPGRAAAWLGALVVSHWALDFLTHRPDLPLWPGGPEVGLGLWHSIPLTILVELTIVAVGLGIYLRATRPLDRTGTVALLALVAVVGLAWISGAFAPPPPSVTAVAVAALAVPVFFLWGHWADRHRTLEPPAAPPVGGDG